jgi:hypothetical protein
MTDVEVVTDEDRCPAVVYAAGTDRQCERLYGHTGSHVTSTANLAIGWRGDTRRLGEEADRAANHAYCCDDCRRKERQ